MLTTDPGDSDECYACKLLEVMIIHCHHSLIQVGGAGTQVGGAILYRWVEWGHKWVGSDHTGGWGGVTGGRVSLYR